MNTGIFVVEKGVRKKLTGRQAYNYIANKEDKSLSKLVTGFVKLDSDGIGIKAIYPTAGRTVYESHPKVVRHLASFAPLFFDLKGDSFVNGKGKQIYPINLRHHMGQIFETLSTPSEDKNKMLDMYRGDKFYVPSKESNENNSLLLRLLESDDYSKEFRNIDLDALKDVTMPDGTVDYENFSASDSLRLRLINYVNLGKKDLFYASIPVQSDRKKFTVFPFPRTKNFEFTGKGTFGISGMSKKAIIKSYITQDLMRIAHGRGILENQKNEDGSPRPPKNLNETYKKNFREARFMQFDGVLDENPIIEDAELTSKGNGFLMSDYIESYVLNPTDLKRSKPEIFDEISQLMDSMSDQALLYFENQAQNIKQKVKDQNITLPVEVSNLGGIDSVISNFVFDDFIARNEISKFLRGSKAHSKDIQTFYKRMGQATTPGVELARASDLAIEGLDDPDGIENYGMPDTFTEATFEDIRLNINEAQVERVKAKVEALREGLKRANVAPELADAIADQYVPGEVEGTDAQGAISIQFYRNIQQGRGEWALEEEKAYEAYVNAPSSQKRFVYQEGFTPEGFEVGQEVPVYPIKPYYERNELVEGVVTTDSHKNSYHLLLEAETLNNPVKNNLRKRMEAVDEFQGMEQIGVANFVTAKKIKINKVNRLSENIEDFEAVEYNTVDSRGLRFPQDIPTKRSSKTMFNRQVRKNTIANIDPEANYVLNAGLDSEYTVTGSELLNMYHSAIERKTQLEFKQIEKELGVDKIRSFAEAGNAAEFNKAMTDFYVKLRDKIKEQNIERDLPTNYDAGLKIKLDAAGRPQFEVPLDFPVYFEKYQRIIFGMAINGAFKQKVPGMEAVQVAEIGSYAESGELNFYTVGENKEGGPRIVHMEIMIREDIARKFGLEPGQDLNELPEELRRIIGYRIPNQGKSSTIIAKIKRILPANYAKAVVVPAQLTKLTGSDFDIDKMFLMFPEVRQTDAGPVKVRPPYDGISKGDININSITDVSILNNIMLDVVEAVQSNINHVNETIAPLDESTLPAIVEALEEKFTDLQAPLQFASANIEIEMGIRNTIGRAMRGLWANFIAGHAVAAYGNVNVNSNYEINLDGTEYPRLIEKAGEEVSNYDKNVPINVIGSRYLSAAVDAAKKPYQYTLNDRTFTYPVEAYWISFTGDTKSLHDFLNVPIIREFTDTYYTKYGGKALHINDAIEDVIPSIFKEQYKDDKDKPASSMTREELENSTELSDVRQYELLLNFLKFREAGRNLTQLFKVITPDSMDGMNSIDSIKSYRSRQNQFDPLNNSEQIFVNYENTDQSVAEQFIGDNSVYPMQRAFSNLFLNVARMGSLAFPMTVSPALDQLDSKIMNLTGNDQLNPETHREIRRAAMLHVMTKEGSPIREFFTDTHLINNYLDKENNLVVKLATLKAKYPNLAKNLFIRKFVEDPSNETEDANVFLLNFDSSYQMTRFEKDAITAAAYRLLNRPEEIVGENATLEERQTIINLAEDLLMNTLIVHGFKQTTGSYQDLIPVTFFTEGRFARYENPGERLGTTIDFFRKQLTSMYDSNSLDNFATDFIRQNYMIAPGGFNLLTAFRKKSTPNEILLNEKDLKRVTKNGHVTPFVVINNFKTGESFLYAAGHTSTGSSVNGKYVKINTLGVDGKLIEGLNPTKSIINKDGFSFDEVILTSDNTRVTTNAGNVASSAAEQNIICA